MKTIAIIGAGVTGTGIAAVCLNAGFNTIVFVRNSKNITIVEKTIYSLTGVISKSLMVTASLSDIAHANIVIEAVSENEKVKRLLYRRVEAIVDAKTIIATNTSSLSLRKLSKSFKSKDRFLALHFFNPVIKMPLVEIMTIPETSQESLRKTISLSSLLGKTPIVLSKDREGYIVNRLLFAFLSEALKLSQEKVATPKDIDRAIELGLHHPMGPFRLMDLIGIDITYDILHNLKKVYKWNSKMLALTKLLKNKRFGRKNGRGFYQYPR